MGHLGRFGFQAANGDIFFYNPDTGSNVIREDKVLP